MNSQTRKEFIQSLGALLALGPVCLSLKGKSQIPQLSFSTLGCPDWSASQVLDFAVAQGYQGVELRGIRRQLDLDKCPEFSNGDAIAAFTSSVKVKKLKIVNIGASASLHHEPGPERTKHLEEAKRMIDLAQKINCPYIRVFPNLIPKEKTREDVVALIVQGLAELAEHARGSRVKVLMETHGDLVYTKDILKILTDVNSKATGLVWDIVNMWEVTKEPVSEVYNALKPFIRHVHIKDAITTGEKLKYTLLGAGTTPIFEAIDLLVADQYQGFYSFEWEKLWHPEIEEPEIALAAFPKTFRQHVSVNK